MNHSILCTVCGSSRWTYDYTAPLVCARCGARYDEQAEAREIMRAGLLAQAHEREGQYVGNSDKLKLLEPAP